MIQDSGRGRSTTNAMGTPPCTFRQLWDNVAGDNRNVVCINVSVICFNMAVPVAGTSYNQHVVCINVAIPVTGT